MKKIFKTSFAIAALSALYSCAGIENPEITDGQDSIGTESGEYEAMTIHLVQTKTFLHNGVQKWSSGDEIHVFDNMGNRYRFTGEDAAVESFVFTYDKWPVGAVPTYAVFSPDSYPVIDAVTNKITVTHPSDQPIVNTGSFGKTANTSVAKIEEADGKYSAEFKNVCGLVEFTLATTYVKIVTIESTDGTPIAGKIVIDYNNGNPTFEADSDGGSSSISLTPKTDGEQYTAATYYACLLPNDLNGIKVTITNINGRSESFAGSAVMKVERNRVLSLGTLDVRTVNLDFSDGNLYGISTDPVTGESEYIAKDDLGSDRSFGIGFKGEFNYYASNTSGNSSLLFKKSDTYKYGFIEVPVYESMYLSKAVVNVTNTAARKLTFYADKSVDGESAPQTAVSNTWSPVKGTSKTWSFAEDTAGINEVGKALPDTGYYLTTEENQAVNISDVTLTYTFTSLGPDSE